ncbi:hypothetical protein NFI96_009265 [Prochilodus magdalenae]|nr:hypothetical protein NFI96_009265 [Prochilodus magdalenae]
MATFRIGQLSEYKEGQEDFESYLERLEQWMIANEVDEGKKVSVFLSVIGAEAYRLLKNLTMPAKPSSLTYKELSEKLSAHYKPKPLVIAERFRFQKRNQLENETVSEYMVALKQLSTHCDFGNHLDEALRDRFVSGLKAEAIQRKLLAERALTFKSACEIALSMEMAARNILEFAGKVKESGTVHKIASTKGNKSPGKKKTNVEYQKTSQTGFKTHQTCYRCGGSHAAHVCRFKNEKCHHCSKVGHIARACREKKRSGQTQYVEEEKTPNENGGESELFGMYSVYTTCNGQKGIMVDVEVEGKPVSMQLDTGAAVTLVPERVYNVALSHLPLEESKMQLSTFSGENIPLLGQVTVKVKYEDQRANLPLVIVRGDRPALLGRNWLSQLKLNWKGIFSVASARGAVDLELEAVLQRHQNVFSDGPGTIREFKASINVKPNAKPIFKKARPVPYALKDAVGRELDRLEQLGIISKVDRSEWAAPIVVVPKADKSIRICGDYKVTVNQSVVDETYPLPNTEDLFATLAGGTLFTKLDLSHAYQQLELEKSSEKFLTINTHRGLYVYHRLSYGVSTAPSIFQGVMDQILQGLDQVTCFLDDILITAKKTRKEHLRKLEEVC